VKSSRASNYQIENKEVDVKDENGREFFERLEMLVPGSVKFDEKSGSVTLIGWKLEKFEDTKTDEHKTDNIECYANRFGAPGMSRNLPIRPVEIIKQELLLIRVVDPFTKPPEEDPGRNGCGGSSGVRGKKASTIENENKSTGNDQHFVPVIKSQLCKRIIHFFRRIIRGIKAQ
jgi:hypothetical protein